MEKQHFWHLPFYKLIVLNYQNIELIDYDYNSNSIILYCSNNKNSFQQQNLIINTTTFSKWKTNQMTSVNAPFIMAV